MEASAISANLVNRLNGLGNAEAARLVEQFQSGQITEKQFIASANSFLSLTRADSGAALARRAGFFGVSLDPRVAALMGDIDRTGIEGRDRGRDVSAMQNVIA